MGAFISFLGEVNGGIDEVTLNPTRLDIANHLPQHDRAEGDAEINEKVDWNGGEHPLQEAGRGQSRGT